MISIAIDGPSGAGKSTLARRLAKELGYVYVDTGAMFRAVGLYALQKGVPPKDGEAVQALLGEIDIRLSYEGGTQHIYLNGKDVTQAVRAEEVGMAASGVSAFLPVRDHLLFAARHGADEQCGDGGAKTPFCPMPRKIFHRLRAERAQRRWKELCAKGETVLRHGAGRRGKRDWDDSHRAVRPLKQAQDAILVDTTGLSLEESYAALARAVRAKLAH
ncbi:MAG: (d)CMP kinase [Ruthenibacterium sp.]